MSSEKFHNTSITIKGLLGLIEAKDIAIPEIQRPFVWKNSQVRDLIDSLYKGYPTGYIILWKNHLKYFYIFVSQILHLVADYYV